MWDKIPSYCHECKHVGHTGEVCYAAGKGVRPPRRNYNVGVSKQSQRGQQATKGKQGQVNQNSSNKDGNPQGNTNGDLSMVVAEPNVASVDDHEWRGPDIMGNFHGTHTLGAGPTSKAAMGSGGSDHSHPCSPPTRHGSRDDCFP